MKLDAAAASAAVYLSPGCCIVMLVYVRARINFRRRLYVMDVLHVT